MVTNESGEEGIAVDGGIAVTCVIEVGCGRVLKVRSASCMRALMRLMATEVGGEACVVVAEAPPAGGSTDAGVGTGRGLWLAGGLAAGNVGGGVGRGCGVATGAVCRDGCDGVVVVVAGALTVRGLVCEGKGEAV